MAPNYSGYPLGSIMGPMGSHWVKKMAQSHKKNTMPQNSNFPTTPRSSIFHKKWKLRLWRQITVETPYGPSWGQWCPIGSKKWVKTVKKLPCLKIRIFDYPAVNNFLQKMEVTVMAPNYSGYPLGSIMEPMGSHWVKKMAQSHKKIPCPKIRIFDYPAVIDFSQKMEVTVMAPNHDGDTLGSILGKWGLIGSKK